MRFNAIFSLSIAKCRSSMEIVAFGADVQWKLFPLGADVQWKLFPLGADVQWKLFPFGADVQWPLLLIDGI